MRTDTTAARTTGDIFQLLKRDHQQVSELLDEIEGTEESDQAGRQQLFERLVSAVEAHSQAEEDVFYSVLEGHDDIADQIDEARQEHDDIDQSLEEIDEVPMSDPEWMDKLHELRQLIQHHVDEEENQIFARARHHIDDDEALRLAQEFVRAKQVAQEDVSAEPGLMGGEEVSAQTTASDEVAARSDMTGGAEPTGVLRADAIREGGNAGGSEREDIEQMSKKELYELARQRDIEGRSAMTKAELVAAIRSAK